MLILEVMEFFFSLKESDFFFMRLLSALSLSFRGQNRAGFYRNKFFYKNTTPKGMEILVKTARRPELVYIKNP